MGIFDKFKKGFQKSASTFSSGLKEIIVKKYDLQPNNISVINRGIDTEYFNQTLSTGIRDNIINNHQIDTAKKIILDSIILLYGKNKFLY